jgi:hypothetical protein
MLTPPRDRSKEPFSPPVPPVVEARGYARHYLKNAAVFWGILALDFGALIAFLALRGPLLIGTLLGPAEILIAGVGAAVSIFRGGRALSDLLGEPIAIQGQVAEKSASLFFNRLAFLEDKYHLRIERGADHRPLALGTGVDLPGGWFLAGQGYHEILAEGDRIRGAVYRRTRVIASLVKV